MSTGVYNRVAREHQCVNCSEAFDSKSPVSKYCSRKCSYEFNSEVDYHRNWRQNNPDRARETSRKHRAANADKRNEYNKQWRKDNPDKALAHNAVRKARKEGLVNQACQVCGGKAQGHHEDYSKPLELTWLCPSHHQERHVAIRNLKDND